jgi:hypothetical protein
MQDTEEETMEKMALLKLRGWRFLFYPAGLIEVYRPDEVITSSLMGEFCWEYMLTDKVHWFYEKEFGDG